MRVFISYSRKDEAVAHFLAYILDKNGCECLIDRKLRTGVRFDAELQEMIQSSDVVLILLTESSTSSAWVNQEIGFSVACNKPVWPLALQENLQPTAMLSGIQVYSLFDWTRPEETINHLVSELKSIETKETGRERDLDQMITGRIARTQFINEKLSQIVKDEVDELTVYVQAAFSSFAVSNDPLYRVANYHTDEYVRLLMQEADLLERLAIQPSTRFKMLLWPARAYEGKHLAARYRQLLNWMRRHERCKTIGFLCAQYIGPNRLIIPDRFCIEGYKLHHTPGYEMTAVRYDPAKIKIAVNDFELIYREANHAGKAKRDAIEAIEKLYKEVSELG